jgi:cobalt-zinc-cadmium efflux system outer membrane protein
VEVADAQRDLASREAWPDLELSAGLGRSSGEDSSERETIVEFGVAVPLPIFNRNQGRITEAEIFRRKAVIEVEYARLTVRTRLHEAYRELERQLSRVTRYRDAILPAATAAMEQTTFLYREGKALVLDVLDAQRVLASNRRALLAARRDLAAAIVALESLTGDEP